MKGITLYIDLDDVGNELCRYLFETYNREHNDSFLWTESETFVLAENKGLKVNNDYFVDVRHRKETFGALAPANGYVHMMKRFIEEGYDVRILTHPQWTSPYCMTEKMQWIQKHLPFFSLDDLIMTKLKGEVAGPGRILLDDNPAHLQAWEDHGGIGVAYTKIAYSKKWTGFRVETFEEFYELVKDIESDVY